MTKPNFGDVYLAKFHPGYGSQLRKHRPAVIVNEKVTDIDSRFVQIVPFTTQKKDPSLYELFVPKQSYLDYDSLLLCWYHLTIDGSHLVRKLGTLSEGLKKDFIDVLERFYSH